MQTSSSAKDRRYDRQLRLWAADGQRALEGTWVVLVNNGPGAVGIETLKNLILPGIGRFTILDDRLVEESDLGVNFFVTEEDLGKPRAEVCARLLSELNPEVQGGYSTESLERFIRSEPTCCQKSLFIIVGPTAARRLRSYDSIARSHGIPLVFVQSVGFYGQVAVSLPQYFPIVDSHPDINSITDLRILDPWPELLEFVEQRTAKIDSLSDDDHGHIPFILILIHYVQAWRNEHHGSPPSTYAEKTQFRENLRRKIRTSTPEGGEENFEEAVAAVLKALNPSSLPSTVRDVFDNIDQIFAVTQSRASELSPDPPYFALHGQTKTHFWHIARAVRIFHKKHSVLPLAGSVPDMKARTEDYVALQKLYKQKARDDVNEVIHIVQTLEPDLDSVEKVPFLEKEVQAFCKTAMAVRVIHGKPLFILDEKVEVERSRWRHADIPPILQNMEFSPDDLFHILFCLQIQQYRYENPDTYKFAAESAQQLGLLKQAGNVPFPEGESEPEIMAKLRERANKSNTEMERAGDAELHNIAAVLGGMAAQEVIKIITRQYIPIDNVMIFDGIQSRTQIFRL